MCKQKIYVSKIFNLGYELVKTYRSLGKYHLLNLSQLRKKSTKNFSFFQKIIVELKALKSKIYVKFFMRL